MKRQFNKSITAVTVAFIATLMCANAHAQFMDRVLVIVNEDVITQSEFNYRMGSVMADIRREGKAPPDNLHKQLLDGMVTDRLQIQEANRRGINISDEELDFSIERYAANQNLTAAQFQQNLRQAGQSMGRFKETVRESLTIQRLTEFYARTRVVVPDYEIDGEIEQNNLGEDASEYEIAHILIKNPQENMELAKSIREEISSGMDFQDAVIKYSQAADAQEGGVLGWRRPSQMPEVFHNAIKDAQVGSVTDVVESPNGLHILKLMNLKGDRTEIMQSQVRHILIAAESKVAKKQAAKKLFDIRKRILDGEDFSQLARIYSDDSVSAATGGNLDWVSPGQMVKPFEDTFNKLNINEISTPVETQYGVHIIEVLDRRQKNVTEQVIRNRVENFLRRRRADREFNQWVRELREQAYIEYVSEPV